MKVKDPVCGMSVETDTAKHRHTHDGVEYFFCNPKCKAKFEAAPETYTKAVDPVCGMTVTKATAKHTLVHEGTDYFFCNPKCKDKFAAAPDDYLHKHEHVGHDHDGHDHGPPAKSGAIYTCPMHPEVKQVGPGSCPKCGMALEPMDPLAGGAEDDGELRSMRMRFWISLAFALPIFVMAMAEIPGTVWYQFALASPVVLWGAWPFFQRAWASIVHRSPNMFTLIGIGVGVAYVFSVVATIWPEWFPAAFRMHHGEVGVYFEAAAVITTLVLLGQVLELKARAATSGAIRALLDLAPKTARRIATDGSERDVPLDEVSKGDRLRVRPGDHVPVDGAIIDGSAVLDESMVTGESLPVAKKAGDKVTGGTLAQDGSFVMSAERVGSETLLARIVHLVADAQRSQAPVQRLADKVAEWFVPSVLLVAVVTFGLWAWIGPEPKLAHALVNAVAVLIIACPCALGLATPMSIMVGTGQGARMGVLVRNAAALERLEAVNVLIVDKTGTLTEGKPKVTDIAVLGGGTENDLLRLAAGLERASGHPLANAVVAAAEARGLVIPKVEDFAEDSGAGVRGTVDGRAVRIGNRAYVGSVEQGSTVTSNDDWQRQGKTVIYIGIDGEPAGLIAIMDPIKATTKEAIDGLRADGIEIVMATGDALATARAVAAQLGIDRVEAGVLPADKSALVTRLRSEGKVVAMAGDGINDAPALAAADVGIAMGTGTDVAMESAAVTLVKGDLRGILRARRLSRATMRNIRQNLVFAFGYNVLGVPIAAGVLYPAFGLLLSPMIASAAMSLSSVSVIANALRLKNKEF